MYDNIVTVLYEPSVEDLDENPLLKFKAKFYKKTGEAIEDIYTTEYLSFRDFIVIKKGNYRELSFSFHKYKNRGIHNHNDFTIKDFLNVMIELTKLFGINPYSTWIHNIEFGVNITLPFTAKEFIDSIIVYKGQEYSLEPFEGRGYMKRFIIGKRNYELKIYDKGQQYGQEDNLIRYEYKTRKMDTLIKKKIPIKTLADLFKPEILNKLSSLLISTFEDLLIDENIKYTKAMKELEIQVLKDGTNPKFWSKLKKANPENYRKKLARFKELQTKYGTEKKQETVLELIKSKLKQLTEITPKTQKEIDQYLSQFEQKTFPKYTNKSKEIFPKLTDIEMDEKKENFPENDTLQYVSIPSQTNLKCQPYFWEESTLIKKFNNGNKKLFRKEIEKPEKGNDKQRQFCREIPYTGVYKKQPFYEAQTTINPKDTNIISKPKFVENETVDEICERISKGDTRKQNWDKLVSFYENLPPERNTLFPPN